MKKIFLIIFFLTNLLMSQATNYYVSSSDGSDSDSGLTEALAWASLAKVNTSAFVPGDQILFKRGDLFYGSLTVNYSGTSGSPIIYGAYGTGSNPIITGFTQVTSWTNLGLNIWESTNAISSLDKCNMVTIGGVSIRMGREPDSGYYYYQSHTNSPSTITSTDLDGVIDWTGAEIAIVLYPWTIGRDPITAQTGGTVTYTKSGSDVNPYQDNQRFLIQNDQRTLDTQNEWYFNPSTKKLRIYSTTQPSNVKITTVDKLVDIVGYDYITIQDITFEGGNMSGISIDNTDNLTVSRCTIRLNGFDGFYGINNGTSPNMIIEDCIISDNNHAGIGLSNKFTNAIVRRNEINNSGVVFGSGRYTYPTTILNNVGHYIGVGLAGSGSLTEDNIITNSGYHGVAFYLSNSIVQRNYIKGFCQTVIDGAGVYTWGSLTPTVYSGMKVLGNVVENDNYTDNGIYADDLSNHIDIVGNTISKCANGIYLHNNKFITVRENTMYDNTYSLLASNSMYSTYPFEGNVFNKNVLVAKSSTQYCIKGDFMERVIAGLTNDSNIIAKPIDDNLVVKFFNREPFSSENMTLSQWKTYSSDDINSTGSPKSVAYESDIDFAYNATSSPLPVTLDFPGIDVAGTRYSSTVTLQPYTSLVLIKDVLNDNNYNKTLLNGAGKPYLNGSGNPYVTQ